MEQDLALLQNISDTLKVEPEASQRQLAQNASISIGLMNAVLKRFVERGWIMLTNVNGRKLAYAVTPKGINELCKRGKAFTLRTFSLANEYNQIIYELVAKAKNEGKEGVRLYGGSSIKFLIVYVCNQVNVTFAECNADSDYDGAFLSFVGELCSDEQIDLLVKKGAISLLDVMQKY